MCGGAQPEIIFPFPVGGIMLEYIPGRQKLEIS